MHTFFIIFFFIYTDFIYFFTQVHIIQTQEMQSIRKLRHQ